MVAKRLPKFERQPAAVVGKEITERSLAIILLLVRYRCLPTSLLVHLIDGDARTTQLHLRRLYDMGLVARIAFPKIRANLGEFMYLLTNADALRLLIEAGHEVDPLEFEVVRNNREKGYGDLTDGDGNERIGTLLFLRHELGVSRFHANLELACKQSAGRVELKRWQQGPRLHSTVEIRDGGKPERLPVRPDALFTLRFTERLSGQNESHFVFEHDRGSMGAERMIAKLRAHFHFICKQGLHVQTYEVPRVRAVLVEAIHRRRANELGRLANNPRVCGPKPTQLFWFTPADLLTAPVTAASGRAVPAYVERPDMIFDARWATSEMNRLMSLLD